MGWARLQMDFRYTALYPGSSFFVGIPFSLPPNLSPFSSRYGNDRQSLLLLNTVLYQQCYCVDSLPCCTPEDGRNTTYPSRARTLNAHALHDHDGLHYARYLL